MTERSPFPVEMAASHAAAGADIIASSGMMDHMVRAIRAALDGRLCGYAYLSYAAKYASTFYGLFPGCGRVGILLGRPQETTR